MTDYGRGLLGSLPAPNRTGTLWASRTDSMTMAGGYGTVGY